MEITMNLGGKLDILTPDELKEFGHGLTRELKKAIHDQASRSLLNPVRRRIADTQPGESTLTVLTLGTPQSGRYWSVNNLVVADDTMLPIDSAAAFLCVGNVIEPTVLDAVHYLPALPGAQNFSPRTLDVPFGETVYVMVITAAPTNTTIVAGMRYSDYPDVVIAPAAV